LRADLADCENKIISLEQTQEDRETSLGVLEHQLLQLQRELHCVTEVLAERDSSLCSVREELVELGQQVNLLQVRVAQ